MCNSVRVPPPQFTPAQRRTYAGHDIVTSDSHSGEVFTPLPPAVSPKMKRLLNGLTISLFDTAQNEQKSPSTSSTRASTTSPTSATTHRPSPVTQPAVQAMIDDPMDEEFSTSIELIDPPLGDDDIRRIDIDLIGDEHERRYEHVAGAPARHRVERNHESGTTPAKTKKTDFSQNPKTLFLSL